MSRVPYKRWPWALPWAVAAPITIVRVRYEVDFSAQADRLKGTPEAARLAVETEDRSAS